MEISLSRIIIFGQDIEKLKLFYVQNFGLPVVEETNHKWVVLNAGTIQIALHKIGEAYKTNDNVQFKALTNKKLVFTITGDLRQLRQTLINNGVLMRELISFEGVYSLFCDGEDPEGNIFQLEQRLA